MGYVRLNGSYNILKSINFQVAGFPSMQRKEYECEIYVILVKFYELCESLTLKIMKSCYFIIFIIYFFWPWFSVCIFLHLSHWLQECKHLKSDTKLSVNPSKSRVHFHEYLQLMRASERWQTDQSQVRRQWHQNGLRPEDRWSHKNNILHGVLGS